MNVSKYSIVSMQRLLSLNTKSSPEPKNSSVFDGYTNTTLEAFQMLIENCKVYERTKQMRILNNSLDVEKLSSPKTPFPRSLNKERRSKKFCSPSLGQHLTQWLPTGQKLGRLELYEWAEIGTGRSCKESNLHGKI